MMINKDIYKIWAPCGKEWVDWILPIPFLAINNRMTKFHPTNHILPYLETLDKDDKTTAIILDLPGCQSVEAGIFLAERGYRPIPIYNGVIEQNGARATMDNSSIASALVWGASKLLNIEIQDDARPAFLIDSNRLNDLKIDNSIFDNSWDIYQQDMPSENYFIKNGIQNILVIGNFLARDLKEIFSEYTENKIQIFWSNGYEEPKHWKIHKLFKTFIKKEFD